MSSTTVHSPAPHPPVGNRWRFLGRAGWLAGIAGALAFAGACFFLLAPWQFGRNTERSAQNTAIDAAIGAPTIPVTELLSASAQPAQQVTWRVVGATGEFDATRQVQVRLRQDSNGQPVSEVITPFRMTDGRLLLIDRGTVTFAAVAKEVPVPAPPAGPVTITGRVQVEQVDPANRQPLTVGNHVEAYAVNLAAVGGAAPDEVFLRGYLQLTPTSPGVLTAIDLPQTDAGPFLSYALQWEAFGVIALAGIAFFLYREAFAPRPPDDRDDRDDRDDPGDGRPGFEEASASELATKAGRSGRPGRDGFDRSQLYDG